MDTSLPLKTMLPAAVRDPQEASRYLNCSSPPSCPLAPGPGPSHLPDSYAGPCAPGPQRDQVGRRVLCRVPGPASQHQEGPSPHHPLSIITESSAILLLLRGNLWVLTEKSQVCAKEDGKFQRKRGCDRRKTRGPQREGQQSGEEEPRPPSSSVSSASSS